MDLMTGDCAKRVPPSTGLGTKLKSAKPLLEERCRAVSLDGGTIGEKVFEHDRVSLLLESKRLFPPLVSVSCGEHHLLGRHLLSGRLSCLGWRWFCCLPCVHPVDFRRGIAALSSYAREHLGVPPDSGVVLVFRSRRPGRVKVLFHDGSGMVLVSKWPDRGSFRWPPVSEGLLRLSRVEFSALFDVCDWRGLKAPRRAVRC